MFVYKHLHCEHQLKWCVSLSRWQNLGLRVPVYPRLRTKYTGQAVLLLQWKTIRTCQSTYVCSILLADRDSLAIFLCLIISQISLSLPLNQHEIYPIHISPFHCDIISCACDTCVCVMYECEYCISVIASSMHTNYCLLAQQPLY